MKKAQTLFTVAFLASLGLAACDRNEAPDVGESTPADTVMQPGNMPAPEAPEAAAGPSARDSAATKPLDEMTRRKESNTMPEAGHGNNHSSPAFKKSTAAGMGARPVRILWV